MSDRKPAAGLAGGLLLLLSLLLAMPAVAAGEEPDDSALERVREALLLENYFEAALLAAAALDGGEVEAASLDALRLLQVRALLGTGDTAGAGAAADKAAAVAPEAATTFAALAAVDVREGQLDSAERLYREATRRDPQLAAAHAGLAWLLATKADRASAEQAYRRAWELTPDDPGLALTLALQTRDRSLRLDVLRAVRSQVEGTARGATIEGLISLFETAEAERPLCRPLEGAATYSLDLIEEVGQRYSIKVGTGRRRPVRMTLDTGAEGLVVDPRVVEEAGIRLYFESLAQGFGDGEGLASALGLMPRVEFGDLTLVDCPVTVARTMFRVSTRGLIGTGLFDDFRLVFDFPAKKLRLERLEPVVDAAGGRALQDSQPGPEHQGWVRVRLWGNHLFLPVRVNGGAPVWFLIDTGAPFNLVDIALARRSVALKRYTKVGFRGVSGEVDEVYQATESVSLAFAGLEQVNDGLLALDLSGLSADFGLEIGGVLGLELLRHLDFRIDYRNGVAKLAPRR